MTVSSNEHTQWSVAQTFDGITGSRTFRSADEALEHARKLLDADPCAKIEIDKYTPTADELRRQVK